MNILFIAPQPFYQDRGTPIAVNLALRVLDQRGEKIDLLTYADGKTINYRHVIYHRIPHLPFTKNIRPGFSWKKIICDLFILVKAFGLARRNKYSIVHAVEESVFIAFLLRVFFKIPYVYDMDSSLTQQMLEKIPWLTPLSFVFNFFEGLAIRRSSGVLAVCQALADIAQRHNAPYISILTDISLLHEYQPGIDIIDVRKEFKETGVIVMYIGNLEPYQGIDLLLKGFQKAIHDNKTALFLCIIGGNQNHINYFQEIAKKLEIDRRVKFCGPKPVHDIAAYCDQADILVSPRIKGNNTPMKIYSFLDSGKALLATDIYSHSQVIPPDAAFLVKPTPDALAAGLTKLAKSPDLRRRLGHAGKELVANQYNFTVLRQTLNNFYDRIACHVATLQ